MAPEQKPRRHKYWRLLRIYFRRFRMGVWLTVLLLIGALFYVNFIGLPGFVKRPLLKNLKSRGIDLQFAKLRFDWQEGIVADDVQFGTPDKPGEALLRAKSVQVGLDPASLLRFRLQIESLTLRQGSLAWPVIESNLPPRQIELSEIRTSLRFMSNDTWVLDNFQAKFINANLRVSGYLTNASAVGDWEFLQTKKKSPVMVVRTTLRDIADRLEKIQFTTAPELNLRIEGDATSLASFSIRLLISAPDARTPWGDFDSGRLTLKLSPASNTISIAELRLEALNAQTRWATVTNMSLRAVLDTLPDNTNLVHGILRLEAGQAHTRWARGEQLLLEADWIHSLTNPVPRSGKGRLSGAHLVSKWAEGRDVQLQVDLQTPPGESLPAFDPSWAWWTNIHPYLLNWQATFGQVRAREAAVSNVAVSGTWKAPDLVVSNLAFALEGKPFQLSGGLDVATRATQAQLQSRIDPLRILPAFPPAAQQWLNQFRWVEAPAVRGRLAVVLPSWTHSQPDWEGAVLPTLVIDGQFDTRTNGSFRGLQISGSRSHFFYSNRVWHLPDLYVERPEGSVMAEHGADEIKHTFFWKVTSTVDPQAVRPLLSTKAQAAFDLVHFDQPPLVRFEVHGLGYSDDSLHVEGDVAVTNVTFRGETASSVHAHLVYTNKLLQVIEPIVWRGTQHMSADGLLLDFRSELIYLTNGSGYVEPMFLARAIGPSTARAIENYKFTGPVRGSANGIIPMRSEEQADLKFAVQGGPFEWWKFSIPAVTGIVHWAGLTVKLSDVRARFYGGEAQGYGTFDVSDPRNTRYHFVATGTNILLQYLVKDVFPTMKGLEGQLNATIVVTRASTAVASDVQGYGQAELSDGLIWDIPVFGVFSPILNGVSPGLGNTRANAASCTFTMTNAVAHSSDMVIHSQGFRLKYSGTVDLEGNTNARAEAELLRDMWVVGPLVSTVLWPVTKMFEYKVSGTIGKPKLDPVYIFPKLVAIPFTPLRLLKGLFQGSGNSNQTNSPPANGAAPPN